ncbi:MAG: hypothetical protein JXR40_06510 [Pontiellaceae bacterium]|nr:hypothetical protein [Pontiellaceae bacterium]
MLGFGGSLAKRLSGAFVWVGVVPLICIGALAVYWMVLGFRQVNDVGRLALEELSGQGEEALTSTALEHLESLQASKSSEISTYFQQRKADLEVLAHTVGQSYKSAVNDLKRTCEIRSIPVTAYLEGCEADVRMLARSQEVLSVFDVFNAYCETSVASNGTLDIRTSEFQELYDANSGYFVNYARQSDFYDIYLVNKEGFVVFSSYREPDLGSNLKDGPFAGMALAEVWEDAVLQNAVVMSDFAPYSPSMNEQSIFIGAPIRNERYEVVAAVVVQVSGKVINRLMRNQEEDSAQTFLVAREDDDLTLRSSFGELNVGRSINLPYLEDWDAESICGLYPDEDGTMLLVSAREVETPSFDWKIVSVCDAELALAPELAGDRKVKHEDWRNDFFGTFVETYELHDLALVTATGHVLYSVRREGDYHVELFDSPWVQTTFARAFERAQDGFAFEDLTLDVASDEAVPCMYMACPVQDELETNALSVVVKLGTDVLSGLAAQGAETQLGMDCYLVGADGTMRSDSLIYPDYSVRKTLPTLQKIETDSVKSALMGEQGALVGSDVGGRISASAYGPVSVLGRRWVLVCERDAADVMQAAERMRRKGEASYAHMEGESKAARQRLVRLVWGVVGVVAVLALLLGLEIARRINRPIKRTLSRVQSSAGLVEKTVNQLAEISDRVALSSQREAASLEQSSAGLEEMSASSRTNSANAVQCGESMERARREIDEVASSMDEMKTMMDHIRESTGATTQIMKSIQDIAFQTNLLSLNAAVEAARAGDAGKGFAVVASEVRSLAGRCRKAAEETTEIMGLVQQHSESGERVVARVAEELGSLRAAEAEVSARMLEIMEASQQQVSGIQELSESVSLMSITVQENAHDASQTRNASLELQREAHALHDSVGELQQLIEQTRSRPKTVADAG